MFYGYVHLRIVLLPFIDYYLLIIESVSVIAMSKKRHDNSSGWKPLELQGSVFAGNVEGLIGIEELTDYKLTKENNKTKILIHNVETNSKEVKVNYKLYFPIILPF